MRGGVYLLPGFFCVLSFLLGLSTTNEVDVNMGTGTETKKHAIEDEGERRHVATE